MQTSKNYPVLKYKLLSDKAIAPQRGTPGSSGLDVFSTGDFTINPFGSVLIPLDLSFDIPFGWDLSVYNKSGVATKLKLDKGAELIDSDYTGNCHIHFFNQEGVVKTISKGQKIAQLVMREVWMGELEETQEIIKETERGAGGFGSTGTTAIGVQVSHSNDNVELTSSH
jgi:dUTP pyrophosphatase